MKKIFLFLILISTFVLAQNNKIKYINPKTGLPVPFEIETQLNDFRDTTTIENLKEVAISDPRENDLLMWGYDYRAAGLPMLKWVNASASYVIINTVEYQNLKALVDSLVWFRDSIRGTTSPLVPIYNWYYETVAFGSFVPTSQTDTTVTKYITNTGTATLSIASFQWVNANPSEAVCPFSYNMPDRDITTAEDSGAIYITFNSTLATPNVQDVWSLIITHNGSTSPDTINVTGTYNTVTGGILAIYQFDDAVNQNNLLDFGSHASQTGGTQTSLMVFQTEKTFEGTGSGDLGYWSGIPANTNADACTAALVNTTLGTNTTYKMRVTTAGTGSNPATMHLQNYSNDHITNYIGTTTVIASVYSPIAGVKIGIRDKDMAAQESGASSLINTWEQLTITTNGIGTGDLAAFVYISVPNAAVNVVYIDNVDVYYGTAGSATVTDSFYVKNIGGSTLDITGHAWDVGSVFSDDFANRTITAGDTAWIRVTMDLNNAEGIYSDTLMFTHDGTGLDSIVTGGTISTPIDPPQGTVYYVSYTDGNNSYTDAQAQNESTPWKTISHVNTINFQDSVTIKFKRGDTWNETIIPATSGSVNGNIVYDAYGTGDRPRICGLVDYTGGWTLSEYGNNVYKSTVSTTWRVSSLTYNGTYLTPAGTYGNSTSGSNNTEWVEPTLNKWDLYQDYLYINVGGVPTGTVKHMNPNYVPAINQNGQDYITIRNLHLGDFIKVLSKSDNSDYWTMDSCILERGGEFLYESSDYFTMTGCEIRNSNHGGYLSPEGNTDVVGMIFDNNYFHDLDGYAFQINTGGVSAGHNYTGRLYGTQITRNKFYNMGSHAFKSSCMDSTLVAFNVFHNNRAGNDVILNVDGDIYYGGIIMNEKIYVYNNTFVRDVNDINWNDGYVVRLEAKSNSATDVTFKNNIVYNYGDSYNYYIQDSYVNYKASLNLYYTNQSYHGKYITSNCTLSGWQIITGQDGGVVTLNPQFTNLSGNDFTLQATSPALEIADFTVFTGWKNIYSLDGQHITDSGGALLGGNTGDAGAYQRTAYP